MQIWITGMAQGLSMLLILLSECSGKITPVFEQRPSKYNKGFWVYADTMINCFAHFAEAQNRPVASIIRSWDVERVEDRPNYQGFTHDCKFTNLATDVSSIANTGGRMQLTCPSPSLAFVLNITYGECIVEMTTVEKHQEENRLRQLREKLERERKLDGSWRISELDQRGPQSHKVTRQITSSSDASSCLELN